MLVVTWSIVSIAGDPIEYGWLLLLVLAAASGWATLRIPGMPISFSISDLFTVASAMLFGPAAGALTAGLDGLVLSLRMAVTRRSAARLAFNVSAPALANFAAAHAFAALATEPGHVDGPLTAIRLLGSLGVFAAVAYVLNTGLVAIAVALDQRTGVADVWRRHFSGLWVNHLGGAFGGMLLMLLGRAHTVDVALLFVPLPVILYMAFRHAVGRAEDQIGHLGKLNRVYVAAIEALAQAVDAKDQVTHGHVRRVQTRALELARALGVDDEAELQAIKAAALLHDIGKLAIPEHILNKPGRLTAAEYEVMKRHAPIGAEILSVIDFPYPVVPIVRHHHENWDGSGYPDGLAGDAIPIGARILAVVDCFDALTSDRPYRPRLRDEEALAILASRKESMYDPRVVDAFFALQLAERNTEAPQPAPPPAREEDDTPAAPGPHHEQRPGAVPDARLLAAFSRLGAVLARTSGPQLAAAVWSAAQGWLPPAALVVYAVDEERGVLTPLATGGAFDPALETGDEIPVGERLSGWVAATGQSVLNSDARLDLAEATRATSSLRSAVAVPIFDGDGPAIGVLALYARDTDAFDDALRSLLDAAADAIASPLATALRESARRARLKVS
ncbi:MAG TPA: HD domain-containing phosphohydrolase [Vicinamibacterales bacterium]